MSQKPQPWYAAYNQPPRSPKHGRNWKPTPAPHRNSVDRTSDSTGAGDDAADAITYTHFTFNKSITYPLFPEPFRAPSIPHAGIRAGELTGCRLWWVTDALKLCSLAHYFIWQPGATIEGKVDEEIDSSLFRFGNPIMGGVYCFSAELHQAYEIAQCRGINFPAKLTLDIRAMFNPDYTTSVRGFAWGTIKLWGEVVEHERGYRAQFAKLTSLDGGHGAFSLSDLRRKYNV